MGLIDATESKVKSGDNLWSIANTLCQNPLLFKKIANDNNLSNADLILPDQNLLITCNSKKNASGEISIKRLSKYTLT